MFDIGWTEMLVIAVIAIVVVGPKDLPRMMRTVGQYVGKAKRMAREFQQHFDDAVRESELDDVRKSINELRSARPDSEIGKAINPLKEAADDLRKTVETSDKDDGDRYGHGFENEARAGGDRPDLELPDRKDAAPAAEGAAEEKAPEPARAETRAPEPVKVEAKAPAGDKAAAATADAGPGKAAAANG